MKKKYLHLLFVLISLSLVSCRTREPKSNHSPQSSYPFPGGVVAYPSAQQSTPIKGSLLETDQAYSLSATLTAIARPTITVPPTYTYSVNRSVCFIDPSLGFSLNLASGWYASSWYDSNTGVSSVTLFNYDYKNPTIPNEVIPKGGMKVSLDVLDLVQGTDFDQFVEDRIKDNESATDNRLNITNPISYTLGTYSGVAFSASGYGPDVMEIILINGNRIAIIGLMPADSPAMQEAISILSSLDLSGLEPCKK
jgi:hypothetical protein